ncbi:MAG: UDP-N-acetylglucosamine 1-carboxyvinyltransferase [Lentisphaeria bacterium]|jgi:UDP-N-acetylglucosamine 1-carboxyvinyltransferase|nr:UDP-N-acetylglucosamine 1-carboxyvinyltransferase [Lentisphaeria bacterium]MDP7743162.1 UDP-N-acetylglucosamine 1-carboxyvinyltransferase [Lentisphaeria bacterium]
MDKTGQFQIDGGAPLRGNVTPSGNKNAALPMIAAALLTDEQVVLENVPHIRDVVAMLKILDHLDVEHEFSGNTLRICAANLQRSDLPESLCREIRTSFLFVAPLLVRLGRADLHPPGGDVIGRRRLDAHVYGLEGLGATVDIDRFEFSAPQGLSARHLFFDEASVTATEHIMMAAVVARGTSIICNAASEPHVQDLAQLLIAMGAKIDGLNTNTLTINGVESLHGTTHRIASDHIEVGSFLALAAATGGTITVNDIVSSHYWMIQRVFQKRFGVLLDSNANANTITIRGPARAAVQKDMLGHIPRVDDGPWPQFPSDLMSTMIVLATQAQGTVLFFEKMFESRMYFVDQLIQMGAGIIVCDPHRVVVTGPTPLRSQYMSSPDIRAGMALLIAALCADGHSVVDNAWVIDRGYEDIIGKLRKLGANIERVD